MAKRQDIVRIKPNYYMHILDNNKNVSRLVLGPATYTPLQHEEIVMEPQSCVIVPPMHYCIVRNPVKRNVDGTVEFLPAGQANVRLGDLEIRNHQPPFPLYPGEEIVQDVTRLEILKVNAALKLKALRAFDDKRAGDLWLFTGPGTYFPKVEVEVIERFNATVIAPGEALQLRAANNYVDRTGVTRTAGSEWLYQHPGPYLPDVDEIVVKKVKPIVLTDTTAIHVEALRNFKDVFGVERKAGEQWLITNEHTESYILTPDEKLVRQVAITVLTKGQYCVVVNAFGHRQVRRDAQVFFLKPLESLENGIQDQFLLTADEAVLLQCLLQMEDEEDGKVVTRRPGDKWMVYGPRLYCPPATVQVLQKRSAIVLGEREGIYVRDASSGKVRMVIGQTYMLEPNEELWDKQLPQIVEDKLRAPTQSHSEYIEGSRGGGRQRDRTRVVTYQLPHNSLAQIYDFKTRQQRLVFGPDLVMLGPDEDFTIISLSGSEWIPGKPNQVTPKVQDRIKALYVFLGPDSMSDVVTVETADHARLSLQLSYSWHFELAHGDHENAKKIFNGSDFVGACCAAMASRIRGAVAAEPFDIFHKNSAKIIHAAVFGVDKATGAIRNTVFFPNNLLTITSVDIQSIECVDQKTAESLQKSVKLAIEITTASQEADARQAAEERNQRAKGELERQILQDKAQAEEERKLLLELQAESAAIESTGSSKAEALALAEARLIEGQSEVAQANLRAEAAKIQSAAELDFNKKRREAELEHRKKLDELELKKTKEIARVEVTKFSTSVKSVGRETIASMARAGPEMQVRLLKGLGLQGYLMTDGSSPINLLNAASALTGTTQ
eukprot:TRINITY_DN6743_c0_g1_i1.p1 TRINITY_DN6743_c0_g1~~TRINITY_DN6743_c0_g1_i1.p1  ORF type:complete len:837 (+),score=148.49 TRINITY_DN6743_c0_g1_i1:513-3023(+)